MSTKNKLSKIPQKVKELASKFYQTYIKSPQGEFFPQRPKTPEQQRVWSKKMTEDIMKTGGAVGFMAPLPYGPFVSIGRTIPYSQTATQVAQRPWHQAALEKAVKRKDWRDVEEILEHIPKTDPYRKGIEKLAFVKGLQARKAMLEASEKIPRLMKLTDLAGKSKSYEKFLSSALRGGFSKEIGNPRVYTGFPNLEALYSTARGTPLVQTIKRTLGGMPTVY